MQKLILKFLLLFVFTVAVCPALAEQTATSAETSSKVTEPTKDTKTEAVRKNYEPASRFVPSEKLRADDAISFPTDI